MHGIISKYLSNLLVIVFTTRFVLFHDYLICVKSSAGVNQNVERLEFFIKKDKFIINIPDSKRIILENCNEWTILRKACNTCRRGPQLCPFSSRIPQSILVERTSGVSRPLTCYQCQQDFTTSLEICNNRYLLHILLHTTKKIDK